MSAHVRGKGLEQAFAQIAELREKNEEEFRKAVRRQWTAGRTDYEIDRALRGAFKTSPEKVRKAREFLQLPPNKRGGGL